MAETIESVKDRISERYLGKRGIHAVGMRRRDNAITVYVNPANRDNKLDALLDALRKDASPYGVITKSAPEADFANG